MIAFCDRATGLLSTALLWIAGICVAAMMFHVSADIFSKYFFNQPIQGTLEVTTYYYMPIVALAPLAVLQRERGHIFVELFAQAFSKRFVLFLDMTMSLLTTVFFGLLGWFAGIEAVNKTVRHDYVYVVFFDLITWPTRWVIPITCAIIVVIAILQALRFGQAFLSAGRTNA